MRQQLPITSHQDSPAIVGYRLWRMLQKPPVHHPLYRRIYSIQEPMTWADALSDMLIAALFWTPTVLLATLFYSLTWVINIGGMLAEQREQRRYDLLYITPGGMIDVTWAVLVSCLRRDESFQRINAQNTWFARSFFFIVPAVCATALILPIMDISNPNLSAAFFLIYAFTLLLALYIDHIHTIVLASMIAVVVPTFIRKSSDARVVGPTLFIVMMVAFYALNLWLSFAILPAVYNRLGIQGWDALLSLPLLRLAIFYLTRELIISGLWHLFSARVEAGD